MKLRKREVNWRRLLEKYLALVEGAEGTNFLWDWDWSRKDWEALRSLRPGLPERS